MVQVTEFSKKVKKSLIDKEKDYAWLAEQVSIKTGLYCDSAYVCRVVGGERNPEKIVSAIKDILEI